jgi:hypothetical protein
MASKGPPPTYTETCTECSAVILLHFQNVLRGPFNHLGNGVAMRISRDQGPQDRHVERALQHLAVCLNFYGKSRR